MLRLCSDSSRSYPGRSAPHAFRSLRSAATGNGCRDGAEVSRGRSRQGRHHSWRCGGWKQAGIESRKTYPAEGPNSKRGMSFSMSFQSTSKSVRAGAGARHGNSAPQDIRSYCRLIKELRLSLTGYGPSLFGNRRMRTRMYGGVGAGGENPPATRLAVSIIGYTHHLRTFFLRLAIYKICEFVRVQQHD